MHGFIFSVLCYVKDSTIILFTQWLKALAPRNFKQLDISFEDQFPQIQALSEYNFMELTFQFPCISSFFLPLFLK